MIRQEDRELYDALVRASRKGRRCVLATIVSTRGSTPRKVGAKMLVEPDAGLVGTVGGGCGEGEVIEAARKVLSTGKPTMVRVDLTRDFLSLSPAVCGGIMDVFVEAVEPALEVAADGKGADPGPDAAPPTGPAALDGSPDPGVASDG